MIKNKTIWWIGAGIMGEAMAYNLLQAWCTLNIYNRTQSKAQRLVESGAVLIDNIAELTQKSDIIISIIWNPQSVKEVYCWQDGVLEHISQWQILIDMTSTQPELAKDIYNISHNKGAYSLDAPVSGWDIWAKAWTLAIMVWWEKEVFDRVFPLFEILWKNIVYQWIAWTGQHTKVANQIWLAWNLIGMCESLVYAQKANLQLEDVMKIIASGAAGSWWWSNLAPRILKWELDTVFFVRHFTKDLKIALDECNTMNITLPWLALVNELYKSLKAYGGENLWTQALIIVLKKMNNI